MRSKFQVSFSRLLSFGRYMFDLEKHEAVKKLFESEKFMNAAKQICPKNKQYLDPFQFNFIIQVRKFIFLGKNELEQQQTFYGTFKSVPDLKCDQTLKMTPFFRHCH